MASKVKFTTSKNRRKKNWRKIDISEVENQLDYLRQKERLGPLFKVDLSPTKSAKKEPVKPVDSILPPHKRNIDADKVEPITTKKAKSGKGKKPKNEKKDKKKPVIQKKHKQPKSKVIPRLMEPKEFAKDIWAPEPEPSNPEIAELQHITEKVACKHKLKRLSLKKDQPTLVPKVEVPDPGLSYNPSIEDQFKLLDQTSKIFKKEMKKEEKLKKWLGPLAEEEVMKYDDENNYDFLRSGLDNKEEDDENDDGEENEENGLSNAKRLPERKLRSKRRKEALLKMKENQKKLEKKRKLQRHMLNKVGSIVKDVIKKEEKMKEKKEKRAEFEIKRLHEGPRVGNKKFIEPPPECQLSGEIADNLRSVKPVADLLAERYKSLQKRKRVELKMETNTNPPGPGKRKKRFKLKNKRNI